MKKQEFNLKVFMQSEERAELVQQINKELNHNSIMVNIKGSNASNLITHTKKVKMSENERKELKSVIKKHKQEFGY